jgi:hypothetical protein
MNPPRESAHERPLFVPVAAGPYVRFIAGTKTVEVRQEAARWSDKHVWEGRSVRMRLGYSGGREFLGRVGRIYRGFWSVAPGWARDGANLAEIPSPLQFFDRTKPVVAFEVIRDGK